MKIAVIGASGLVGTTMIKLLAERNFPLTELLLGASERSVGKTVDFKGKTIPILSVDEVLNRRPDIALFSAGSAPSLLWAPRFAEAGTFVIDNSSAWRMHEEVPLVVPEINADIISAQTKIIANPNCSTIQMVMVLNPLHQAFQIDRVVVSTYQSVSGSGAKALNQLEGERKNIATDQVYPYVIHNNLLPHIDQFLESGYTKEEMKMVNETHKIMRDHTIKVSPTAIRVPVSACHSESVNIAFKKTYTLEMVRNILDKTPGLKLYDDVEKNIYPMPVIAEGKDDVYVGRLRRDDTVPSGLNLWIVADNIRKGAATNAVQIAEYIALHLMIS